ncbi:hypothetical protein ANCDUO_25009 [Ancylostoma duodenale]|uniref:Palmitoyltransferase n=1 Tax=Ancylostoma duodenale TaxID=51022 RepID=A0A0C2FJC4_9BILA|nr:hypothetical protein ANCDUO_25009 [Ancylostoma duodenale]
MSWYSVIYTRVREYKQKNPIRGFFLARLLNALLFAQVAGLAYSIYVYLYVVCGYFLQSSMQVTIYICVYFSVAFMALWCLFSALFYGVARIPPHWTVSAEVDAKLKSYTPFENGRYMVDKSTPEQVPKNLAPLGILQQSLQLIRSNNTESSPGPPLT